MHTQGPWIAADVFVNNAPNRLILRQAKYGGDVVADMGNTEDANIANARLIAAAPDLLDALQNIVNRISEAGQDSCGQDMVKVRAALIDEARSAIAKATA
jgi:hypothetical protein